MELDLSQLMACQKQSSVDEDEIQTAFNSLFVTKVNIDINLIVPEEAVELVGMETMPAKIEKNKYTLYYAEFGHNDAEQHVVLEKLRRSEPGDLLTIRIDSPGGYVFEGYKVLNIINEKFKKNSEAYIDGVAYSMGAFIFCSCEKRVVYETSSIMFHDFSGGEFGKGGEMRDSLEHSSKLINKIAKRQFVSSKFMTEEEFNRMVNDGKQWWMDAEEMCYRGIATHVMVDDIELEANDYIEFIEYGCTLDEYVDMKNEEYAKEIQSELMSMINGGDSDDED